MEIRHLNTFIQVATLKNFTKAAKNLGYCQSNVSAQIQQLENEIGVPLFNRIGKKISLTQYGEELLPHAQQIVSSTECIENFMRNENEMGGTVKVGIVESLFEILFEPTLTNYHKRFPNVKIDIAVDSTASLKEKLKDGMLDTACLIDSLLSNTDWNCWHTEMASIVIIANPKSDFLKKENITLKSFEGMEFVLMEDMANYSQCFRRLMQHKNVKYHSFLKLQSASMARRLVENNNFLSVLPHYSIKKSADSGKIKIVDVKDFSHSQFVQIILHQNKVITPQLRGFLEELVSSMKSFISSEAK